jgi:hypothetical protein
MISSLVRWFRPGAVGARSGRGAGSARRFTPGLEALEDRAVPTGVVHGGSSAALLGGARGGVDMCVSSAALLGAEVGGPSHVIITPPSFPHAPSLAAAKDGGPSHVIPLDSKPGGAGDGVSSAAPAKLGVSEFEISNAALLGAKDGGPSHVILLGSKPSASGGQV